MENVNIALRNDATITVNLHTQSSSHVVLALCVWHFSNLTPLVHVI